MFARKTQVILDTNILMLPGLGVDVFTGIHDALTENYELATYSGVLDELQTLMLNKSKDGFNAKLGFILAKQKALKTLTSSSKTHVDDVIVEKSTPKGTIVATQDKELIARLRQKGVRVLRYQQKKFVFQP